MNERAEPKRRLVADVAAEHEDYAEFERSLRRQAMAQFRRARFVRKMGHLSTGAAALLLSGGLVWVAAHRAQIDLFELASAGRQAGTPQPGRPATAGSTRTPGTVVQPVLTANDSRINALPVHLLSDSELLAAFPPDSCFLAEVNGKTVVVFYDPEVGGRFFR